MIGKIIRWNLLHSETSSAFIRNRCFDIQAAQRHREKKLNEERDFKYYIVFLK